MIHLNFLFLLALYNSIEGSFTVKALAFDHTTTLNSELQVVVADVPCDMPVVKIIDAEKAVYAAPTNFRSFETMLSSSTELKCNKTVKSMYVCKHFLSELKLLFTRILAIVYQHSLCINEIMMHLNNKLV